jgi:hypothetical protein
MVFKDATLLQEAYISATQKTVNVPSTVTQQDAEVAPEPVMISITGEPNTMEEPSTGCGCGGSEEGEENYMAMANLFSLFSNAKKLHHYLMSGVGMEPWMQQKIAVCADNLEAVARSVNYDAAKAGVCD